MKRDLIDRVLDFGQTLDWITPLSSLLSSDVTMVVDRDDMGDVDWTLKQLGIRQKRKRVAGNDYTFDVRREDAQRVASALWGDS